MEAARHKLIEFYDNQEEQKKAERYAGVKVIRSQIAVSIHLYILINSYISMLNTIIMLSKKYRILKYPLIYVLCKNPNAIFNCLIYII